MEFIGFFSIHSLSGFGVWRLEENDSVDDVAVGWQKSVPGHCLHCGRLHLFGVGHCVAVDSHQVQQKVREHFWFDMSNCIQFLSLPIMRSTTEMINVNPRTSYT